jgi:beta-lactamase regulating signal transducer with metallopeptidase domain
MTWTLLVSLLVKSSLVAGAGLACARFLTQRPVDRVDILRATVCLLLALPVIMNVLPEMNLALLPPSSLQIPPAAPSMWTGETGAGVDAAVSAALPWPPSGLIGGLWLLGFAAIAGRLLLGLRTLERWTRQASPVTCADWQAPLEDLSPADRPGLVSSDRVASPLSWGVAPGFIVVDPASLAERHAAPAILAHELAHLRRHDWIFLVLSRLVLAIFWFNPLVWRLHAVLAERSEEAADAVALETVDRTLYARALVRLAAHPAPHPAAPHPFAQSAATAMAADARTLKTRIACIMTNTSARRRPLTVALTVVALAAVATPLAALGVSRQDWVAPPAPPAPPPAPLAAPVPPLPPAPPEPIELSALVPPAPPAPPAPPPAPPEGLGYSYVRFATDAEQQDAAEARAQAEEARAQAAEARQIAAESRAQARIARMAANDARVQADQARVEGEQARMAGERARDEAARHMVEARAQMAQGAVQMREGARDMRAEAVRLRDPAYRARQIAENRGRGGHVVTDAELRALADRLPAQADDLERQADRLAAEARKL